MSNWFTKQDIDFVGKRRFFATLSLATTAISVFLFFVYPGPQWGVDFKGGTNVVGLFAPDVQPDEIRSALSTMGYPDAEVQQFGSDESGVRYTLQMEAVNSLAEGDIERIEATVVAALGAGTTVEFSETQGDRVYVRAPEAAFLNAEGSGLSPIEGSGVDLALADWRARGEALAPALASALETAGFPGSTAELFGNPSDRQFSIGLQTLQAKFEREFSNVLGDRFQTIEQVESVGPRAGQQLRDDAAKSMSIALLLILVYIAVRFDIRYAPGAIVALIHDVTITLGIFVLLGEEVNLPVVAAVLTIIGYSLNDTIVNFDRIRENIELNPNVTTSELFALVNRSVNEMLSRTMLTAFTTLLAIGALLFFGGGILHTFSLSMFIGVTVGVYSSIYISNPMMVWTSMWLERRKAARTAEAKIRAEALRSAEERFSG